MNKNGSIKRLVIVGSNGMLGMYLKKYFMMTKSVELITIDRDKFDAYTDSIDKLEQLMISLGINDDCVVFNSIGLIPQASKNKGELSDDQYIKINQLFPHFLNQLCEKFGAKLVHPTTDCVFTGSTGKYNENDTHDESSVYGKTKSLGEPTNCTVIRTSIIGEEVNNQRSLVEWIKSNNSKEINGYINHYWNGITCLQYAKVLETMITNNVFWKGVRHIFSPRTVSKFEIASMVNDVYKLNIKVKEFSTPDKSDKSISTVYTESSLFKIPDLKKQIEEMREFSNVLYDNAIPKVFYAYWDGSPLSYLQYLTIITFKKHNPDWSVVIYMPICRHANKTWHTTEQKTLYTGKDYMPDLLKLEESKQIEIRKIDFKSIGFENEIPEVIKSDYLRYWLLGNYGGLWSDMDIIYIKPISALFKMKEGADTIITYFDNHYPIGMLLSKRNNPYFLEISGNARKRLNINNYQSIGCLLLKGMYYHPSDIEKRYPNLNILVTDNSSYLPYRHSQLRNIFVSNVPSNIKHNTVGIHWFNGSSEAVKFENMIDVKQFPKSGSIYPYVKEYFEQLPNIELL